LPEKAKAGVHPYPSAGLPQNITFRAVLEIAYTRANGSWSIFTLVTPKAHPMKEEFIIKRMIKNRHLRCHRFNILYLLSVSKE
jgi:hypothetical protein